MPIINAKIKPGTMLSDVSSQDLNNVQHQKVVNLVENKKGEWECVKGYVNVATGLTNIISAVEVTEDQTSERFLLIQDGQLLKRIDYNNGYLGETINTLTLPTGVTISASAKLRFFYFRGIVRITGASHPMWYGYVNRTLFPDADDNGEKIIAEWVLEKAELQSYGVEVTGTHRHITGSSGSNSIFVRTAFVYDGSQYSLEKDADVTVSHSLFLPSSSPIEIYATADTASGSGIWIDLRIPIAVSGVNINKRLTGILVLIGTNTYGVFDEATNVWRVGEYLDFSENLGDINYSHASDELSYDGVNDNRLDIGGGNNVFQDGYLMTGATITLYNNRGTITDATITSVNTATGPIQHFEMDTDVSPLLNGSLGTPENLPITAIKIKRYWDYNASTGYSTRLAVIVGAGDTQADFTSIPVGTKHNTPNYTHYAVIEDIAYCASQEAEEEDSIRYSPINQFDNFPISNLIQTEVGSIDSIKAITKRSNRLLIMKGSSISQGNIVGGQYFEDIGISQNGLFSTDGFVTQGATTYFIDKDDIYVFSGGEPQPLLRSLGMRSVYRENINKSSFIAYNMLDNELLILAGTKIFSYRFDKQIWSERSADVSFVHTFRDSDRRLLLCSQNKIVTYNHEEVSFSESIGWSFKSRIFMGDRSEFLNKLNKLNALMSASGDVVVSHDDPSNNAVSISNDLTPDNTYLINKRINPRFLFKQLDVMVTSKNNSNTQKCKIKEIDLQMEIWNK